MKYAFLARRGLLRGCLALALVAVCLVGQEGTGAPPTELKKVRILLVVDTNSDLKESVQIDGDRMKDLFSTHLPAARYDLKTLTGGQVTRENILNYYRQLRTDSSEALLFYYAGHGATDDGKGDYFHMQKGGTDPLLRSDLRKAMESKHAGLVILLTDCCSNRYPLPKRSTQPAPETSSDSAKGPTLSPVLRCLLFQHHGVVDITAATRSAAYGDDLRGGLFTRSLNKTLTRPMSELAKSGDGFVTWKSAFPRLEREVETAFDEFSKLMRARGQKLDGGKQRPRAYALGEAAGTTNTTTTKTTPPPITTKTLPPPPPPAKKESAQAVVSLLNDTDDTIRYQYRWTGETTWTKGTLAARGKTVHARPLADESKLPSLELQIEGNVSNSTVESRRWVGAGTPPFAEGREFKIVRKTKSGG